MSKVKLAMNDEDRLVSVSNEVQRQLAYLQKGGKFDYAKFLPILLGNNELEALTPLADELKDGFPEMPSGISIAKYFPSINIASGGVYGLWVIGGAPGVGKSTMAWQLALLVGQAMPVLVYDVENGKSRLLYRLGMIAKGNVARAKGMIKQVYLRNTVKTLDADLVEIGKPSLIMIDSFQKLPTANNKKREGLDNWLARFERLVKQGHAVLCVSEITVERGKNGQPPVVAGFKETRELEYSATFAFHLVYQDDGILGINIVKNRDRVPAEGIVSHVRRCPVRKWWYIEE